MTRISSKKNFDSEWAPVTLPDIIGDNGLFVDGDWIESKDQDPNGEVRLIQLADIGDGDFRNKSSRFLTLRRALEIKCTFLAEGDILLARMPDPLGRACIFPLKGERKFVTAVDVAIIRANNKKVNSKFLLYTINNPTYRRMIEDLESGTTRKRISRKNLSTIPFSLPSIGIQNQIVSKIEELFSELNKGIETLKLAQQQLKVYRQSVLKWAFVNDSFEKSNLNDVTNKIQIGPFGTQLHKEDYVENGIPLINPTHIKAGKIVADTSFSILKSKRDSLPNYILEQGDVIMGRRGEMGRCGLVTTKETGWFCGTGSLYFRPNKEKVNEIFLYYYLCSQPVKKYLDDNAGGTTMANLNLKIVNDIPISLPTIQEQVKIVQSVESSLTIADKMEESINQSLQQSEALRQSILKRAFEGKLVK